MHLCIVLTNETSQDISFVTACFGVNVSYQFNKITLKLTNIVQRLEYVRTNMIIVDRFYIYLFLPFFV